jgi:hypothetical protein
VRSNVGAEFMNLNAVASWVFLVFSLLWAAEGDSATAMACIGISVVYMTRADVAEMRKQLERST